MTKIVLLFGLLFSIQIQAQSINLPPNIKPEKCYIKNIDNNTWMEIDCNKFKDFDNNPEKIKKFKKN